MTVFLRRATLLLAAAVALLVPAAGNPAPPALRVSGETVEATGPDGAQASYHVKAVDPTTSEDLAATCDTPPGTAGTGSFTVTAQFPLGSTTVTCHTTTSDGTGVDDSASVVVQDTTPPVVSVPANISTSTTDPGGKVVTYPDATANDVVDGALTPSCAPASGSTFPVGTTTVTCTATDSHSNTGTGTFTVTVTTEDTTPPVINVPSDISTTTDTASGKVVTYSASATDNLDGPIPVSCSPASGSTFPVGTTTVGCSATDSHGNSASASFKVTVTLVDTTAPNLTVPGDFSMNTSNPSGAAVTYSASATDNLDGAVPVNCAPASGSTFPVGSTLVTCTATDAHSNTTQKTFTVTVVLVDTAPPVISGVPANIRREADGPNGSIVTYVVPTAVDALDGPLPVSCAPPSGSRFRLGDTIVTCSATDAHGNTATVSFKVSVVDTTPPRLLVPPASQANATVDAGIPASEPVIAAFLAAAAASDTVDPSPVVTNDAPAFFPVGVTTVTFTAKDASGNVSTGTATMTVRPKPPAGTPQVPPVQVDRTAPGDVKSLKAKGGNRIVRLTWANPSDADFDRVEIVRSGTEPGAPGVRVYRGAGKSFADRSVQNDVAYRYLAVAFDHTGNASRGVAVAATPLRALLVSPPDGAKLKKPPRLDWQSSSSARYYNVQLFVGNEKVLSAWPNASAFALTRTWKYKGKRRRLSAGLYRWYVWPGLGPRKDARYGTLMGTSTFRIVG